MAASSRCRSNPIRRAFTVTTTKLTMNITCAMKIVQKPSWKTPLVLRNSVRRDAPSTISGVAIGRKTRTFVVERPTKRWRTIASAISVPSDRRHERGEDADLDGLDHGRPDAEDRVPVDPVVEGEALPDVVEAALRRVEREEDDDSDRQHEVRDGEERVHGQRVPLRQPPRGAHPVSFSGPTTRA